MPISELFRLNSRFGARLGQKLAGTLVSSSHLTTLSLGAGLGCGFFYSTGRRSGLLLGTVLLELFFLLQHAARRMSAADGGGERYRSAAGLVVAAVIATGLASGATALGVPTSAVRGWWAVVLAGAIVAFLRGAVPSRPKPLPGLACDAEPTLFIYALALIGSPWLMLVAAAVYAHASWIVPLALNRGRKPHSA